MKTIAAALVAALLFQEVALGASAWPTYKDAPRQSVADAIKVVRVPESLGMPRAARIAGDRTIVHIEDAHDSLEAQEKITGILEVLAADYDVKAVALEGSSGSIDTTLFKTYPYPKAARTVAEDMMKSGLLNAGELFAMTTEHPVAVYGAEDASLYRGNLKAYQDLLAEKERLSADLEWLEKTFAALAERVYGPAILEVRKNGVLSTEDGPAFTKKWEALRSAADARGVHFRDYPSLAVLDEVTTLEKRINFEAANAEREKLLAAFNGLLKPADREKVVLHSLRFKAGKATDADFHLFLTDLADRNGVDAAGFPNLALYTKYLLRFRAIDLIGIFDEIDAYEDRIKRAWFTGEDERTLDSLERSARTVLELLRGTASSDDWSVLCADPASFDVETFAALLSGLAARHGGGYDDARVRRLFRALPKARRFYEAAEKRNEALVRNTVVRMEKDGRNVAALVTGGFHTAGIRGLLERRDLSYLIVIPRIVDPSKKRPYVAVLTRRAAEIGGALDQPSSRYQIARGPAFDRGRANGWAASDLRVALRGLHEAMRRRSDRAPRLRQWMEDYAKLFVSRGNRNRLLEPANVSAELSRIAGEDLSVPAETEMPYAPAAARMAAAENPDKVPSLILSFNLSDLGTEIREGKAVQVGGGLEKMRRMLPRIAETGAGKIYLYGGMYAKSAVSKKVHQVDQLPEDPDVTTQVVDGTTRYYIHEKRTVVSVRNYVTKRAEVEGVDMRDRFGNPFSIYGMERLNPDLAADPEAELRALIDEAHALGIKVVTDFIPWLSPDAIDQTNYKWTYYREVAGADNEAFRAFRGDAPAVRAARREFLQALLNRPENDGQCAVVLKENGAERVILVRHLGGLGGANVDQVELDVENPDVQAYYLRVLRAKIDRGEDEVRMDLAQVLLRRKTRDSEPLLKIIGGAKDYARRRDRSIRFNMEAYTKWDRDYLYDLGADHVYSDTLLNAFFGISRFGNPASNLNSVVLGALNDSPAPLLYPSNFDQLALAAVGGSARAALLLSMTIARLRGVPVMIDGRDWMLHWGNLDALSGGGNDPAHVHAHLFVKDKAELDARRDFEATRRSFESAPGRAIMEDLKKLVRGGETWVGIYDNQDTRRFFNLAWRAPSGEWNMIVLNFRPSAAAEEVWVQAPSPLSDSGDFTAADPVAGASAERVDVDYGDRLVPAVRVSFAPGEEYKILTFTVAPDAAVPTAIVETRAGARMAAALAEYAKSEENPLAPLFRTRRPSIFAPAGLAARTGAVLDSAYTSEERAFEEMERVLGARMALQIAPKDPGSELELRQATLRLVEDAHDRWARGEYAAIVMSGGGAALTRALFRAAWRERYQTETMPDVFVLGHQTNDLLFQHALPGYQTYAELTAFLQDEVPEGYFREIERRVRAELEVTGVPGTLDVLKERGVLYVDDIYGERKHASLETIFERLGVRNPRFSFFFGHPADRPGEALIASVDEAAMRLMASKAWAISFAQRVDDTHTQEALARQARAMFDEAIRESAPSTEEESLSAGFLSRMLDDELAGKLVEAVWRQMWREPASRARLSAEFGRRESPIRLARIFLPLLRARAAARRFSLGEYLDAVAASPSETDAFRKELERAIAAAPGETRFFRSDKSWQLDAFLPDLLARKWERGDRRIRARSLGGSFGPEGYSLAMEIHEELRAFYSKLVVEGLREKFEDWVTRWDVRVESYDVALAGLIHAEVGVYPEKTVTAEVAVGDRGKRAYREKFFERHPDGFVASPLLRRWMDPVYTDLETAEGRTLAHGEPYDVTIALGLLSHVSRPAARALADLIAGSDAAARDPRWAVYSVDTGILGVTLAVRVEPDGRLSLTSAQEAQRRKLISYVTSGTWNQSPFLSDFVLGLAVTGGEDARILFESLRNATTPEVKAMAAWAESRAGRLVPAAALGKQVLGARMSDGDFVLQPEALVSYLYAHPAIRAAFPTGQPVGDALWEALAAAGGTGIGLPEFRRFLASADPMAAAATRIWRDHRELVTAYFAREDAGGFFASSAEEVLRPRISASLWQIVLGYSRFRTHASKEPTVGEVVEALDALANTERRSYPEARLWSSLTQADYAFDAILAEAEKKFREALEIELPEVSPRAFTDLYRAFAAVRAYPELDDLLSSMPSGARTAVFKGLTFVARQPFASTVRKGIIIRDVKEFNASSVARGTPGEGQSVVDFASSGALDKLGAAQAAMDPERAALAIDQVIGWVRAGASDPAPIFSFVEIPADNAEVSALLVRLKADAGEDKLRIQLASVAVFSPSASAGESEERLVLDFAVEKGTTEAQFRKFLGNARSVALQQASGLLREANVTVRTEFESLARRGGGKVAWCELLRHWATLVKGTDTEFSVPDGKAVNIDEFWKDFLDANTALVERANAMIDAAPGGKLPMADLIKMSALINEFRFPAGWDAKLAERLAGFGGAVIVRSSQYSEDSYERNLAGAFISVKADSAAAAGVALRKVMHDALTKILVNQNSGLTPKLEGLANRLDATEGLGLEVERFERPAFSGTIVTQTHSNGGYIGIEVVTGEASEAVKAGANAAKYLINRGRLDVSPEGRRVHYYAAAGAPAGVDGPINADLLERLERVSNFFQNAMGVAVDVEWGWVPGKGLMIYQVRPYLGSLQAQVVMDESLRNAAREVTKTPYALGATPPRGVSLPMVTLGRGRNAYEMAERLLALEKTLPGDAYAVVCFDAASVIESYLGLGGTKFQAFFDKDQQAAQAHNVNAIAHLQDRVLYANGRMLTELFRNAPFDWNEAHRAYVSEAPMTFFSNGVVMTAFVPKSRPVTDAPDDIEEVTTRVPAAAEPQTETPRQAADRRTPPAAPSGKLSVLIADDNADSADTLALLLQSQFGSRAEFRVANSCTQVVTLLAERPADVVIRDIAMPGDEAALNEALKNLKTEYGTVVIVMSGFAQTEFDDPGMVQDKRWIKPFDFEEVSGDVEGIFDEKRPVQAETPAAKAPEIVTRRAEPEAPAPSAAAQSRKLRVLVVDDNEDAASSLTMLLQISLGQRCEVEEQFSYAGAVASLTAKPADVVIRDIALPGDGTPFNELLKAQKASNGTTVMLMSGYAQVEMDAPDLVKDTRLVKPVDIDELLGVMTPILDAKLPLETPATEKKEATATTPSEGSAARKLRVVIIDDFADAADTLAGMLALRFGERAQFETHRVLTEAITSLRSAPADVVIRDIAVPGTGYDELNVLLRDQKESHGTKIVLNSRYSRTEFDDPAMVRDLRWEFPKPDTVERDLSALLDAREAETGNTRPALPGSTIVVLASIDESTRLAAFLQTELPAAGAVSVPAARVDEAASSGKVRSAVLDARLKNFDAVRAALRKANPDVRLVILTERATVETPGANERLVIPIFHYREVAAALGVSGARMADEPAFGPRVAGKAGDELQQIYAPRGARVARTTRLDRTSNLRAALRARGIEGLRREVRFAAKSQLDYFVFWRTLHRLFREDAGLWSLYVQKRDEMMSTGKAAARAELSRFFADFSFDANDLPIVANLTGANAASPNVYFDYTPNRRAERKMILSNPRDLSFESMERAVGDLLEDRTDNGFLLSNLRQVTGRTVSVGDLAGPSDAILIQEGNFQAVYLVVVPLRRGRGRPELVPFVLMAAKAIGQKSDTVQREFDNLAPHRGKKGIVQVLTSVQIPVNGLTNAGQEARGRIAAYSSRFLNNHGEVFYLPHQTGDLYPRHADDFMYEQDDLPPTERRQGIVYLNSSHPERIGIFPPARERELIGAMLEPFVFFSDVEHGRMIDGFNVNAGDLNFFEAFLPSRDGASVRRGVGRADDKARFTLIALRGMRRTDPASFVSYLFTFLYLSPRLEELVTVDGENGQILYELYGERLPEFVILGVLDGLRRGLERKHGVRLGRAYAREWLEAYLAAATARPEIETMASYVQESRIEPLVPRDTIRRYIETELGGPSGARLSADEARDEIDARRARLEGLLQALPFTVPLDSNVPPAEIADLAEGAAYELRRDEDGRVRSVAFARARLEGISESDLDTLWLEAYEAGWYEEHLVAYVRDAYARLEREGAPTQSYAHYSGAAVPAALEVLDAVGLGDLKGKRVLDAAAGLGGFGYAAASRGADVVAFDALDRSARAGEFARRLSGQENLSIPYVVGRLSRLSEVPGTFDVIVIQDTMYLFPYALRVKILKDMISKIAPGGAIILLDDETKIRRLGWIDPADTTREEMLRRLTGLPELETTMQRLEGPAMKFALVIRDRPWSAGTGARMADPDRALSRLAGAGAALRRARLFADRTPVFYPSEIRTQMDALLTRTAAALVRAETAATAWKAEPENVALASELRFAALGVETRAAALVALAEALLVVAREFQESGREPEVAGFSDFDVLILATTFHELLRAAEEASPAIPLGARMAGTNEEPVVFDETGAWLARSENPKIRELNGVYRTVFEARAAASLEVKGRAGKGLIANTPGGVYAPTHAYGIERILEDLQLPADRRAVLLDLGTGIGLSALMFAILRPDVAEIVSIEMDPVLYDTAVAAVALAEARGLVRPGQIRLLFGDFFSEEMAPQIARADRVYYYTAGSRGERRLGRLLSDTLEAPDARIVAYGYEENPLSDIRFGKVGYNLVPAHPSNAVYARSGAPAPARPDTGARLASVVRTPVVVGVPNETVARQVREALGSREDVAVFNIPPAARLVGPEAALAALESEASRRNAAQALYVDEDDLNREAKFEFLRQIDAIDAATRPVMAAAFADLLAGRKRLADFRVEERDALAAEIARILPRIAPKGLFDDVSRAPDAETALELLKLRLFHPSFGYRFRDPAAFDPSRPKAVAWSLAAVLKDPLFLRTLDDRDAKLKSADGRPLMPLRDFLVLRPGEEERLDEMAAAAGIDPEALRRRFGGRFLTDDGSGLRGAFEKLAAVYAREDERASGIEARDVLFVDNREKSTLSKEGEDLGLLYVEGPYAMTLDKVVVEILAAGEASKKLLLPGLSFENGVFIFQPAVPIDYAARLKDFYRTLTATASAA